MVCVSDVCACIPAVKCITYHADGTEDVDVKGISPLSGRRVGNLLDGVQRAVVDDQGIEATPALEGAGNKLGRERGVRGVASDDFYAVSAVLVGQRSQGGGGARGEDELGRGRRREKVSSNGEADAARCAGEDDNHVVGCTHLVDVRA